MIYTLENMKTMVRPMADTFADLVRTSEDKDIPDCVDNFVNAMIEVIKQDREAHANNPNTEMAANDD